jgi:hypothetical protein
MTLVSYPTNFFTVIQASSTTTAPTIYAGRTSSSPACSGPQCDSCTGMAANFDSANGSGTPLTPPESGQFTTCSVKETHAADTMSLTVSSNLAGGVPNSQMYIQSTGGTTSSFPIPGVFFNGSSLTFTIPWSLICEAAIGDLNCSTSFPSTPLNIGWGSAGAALTEYVTLQIAFRYVAQSPNYASWCFTGTGATFNGTYQNDEGFCYFTAYPGDSKAYIFPTAYTAATYVVPDLSYPSGTDNSQSGADPSGMTYGGVAVFYSTNQSQFTTATPHQTMTFASTTAGTAVGGSLSPKYITGLTNGTPYYMTIASVDQAGILTFFSDPNPATMTLGYPMSFTTQVVPPEGSSQAVIPEPVEGLLNGQSCFIATAAYGSVMAPEVETFRQFRGKFLLKSKAGRWFVRTYYKLSPPLADFIAHNDGLRFGARAILLPLLAFVKMSLAFGLAPTFFSLILAAFLIWIYLRWGRRQRWTGDER